MAFVVTEPCRGCKYTDCVVVCPMNCFYQDETMLYIDPVECIHCNACASECPVEAIYADEAVPKGWASYIPLNAQRVRELQAQGVAPTTEK